MLDQPRERTPYFSYLHSEKFGVLRRETTVSGVLERDLDAIASAHIEELSAALPGFAEAMAWPAG